MRAKFSAAFAAMVVLAMTVVSSAMAAADTVLTQASGSITSYFTDNVGTVIAAFVAIGLAIWLLRMLFRSVGVGRPKSVN